MHSYRLSKFAHYTEKWVWLSYMLCVDTKWVAPTLATHKAIIVATDGSIGLVLCLKTKPCHQFKRPNPFV